MNILIAVDDAAVDVVEHAHALFGDDATYHVASIGERGPHVYPATALGVQPALMWVLGPDVTIESAAELATETVEQAADISPDDVQIIATAGPIGPTLCSLAGEHDIDVVVVGTHERGWLSRLITPSVSHYVVDHAPCDVLVVRADEPAE